MNWCLCILCIFALSIDASEIDIEKPNEGAIISNSGPVLLGSRMRSQKSPRQRRQGSLGTAYALSQDDVQFLVNEHNKYRKLVPATDMQMMTWDTNLAASALAHASRCMFAHSSNRVNTGENLYASPFNTLRGSVQMWFNEVYDQRCGCTNYYKHCCGHYTQIAWASSSRLGCGYAYCNNVQYAPVQHYMLVCHYSPAGNIIGFSNGQTVGLAGFTYKQAGQSACSACPTGFTCNDGLCAWG